MNDEEQGLRLTLYVAGQNPRAERAITKLRHSLGQRLGLQAQVTTIDVLDRPDLAEEALILATPTLIKESPDPVRRMMGDLSDTDRVIEGLRLDLTDTSNPQVSVADD
jgi:circadian clock protein KaiB